MTFMTTAMGIYNITEKSIISQTNLTLYRADYFQTCWRYLNSSESISCSYLLNHAVSYSNSSYFCVYHTIRQTIECYNSSYIFPKSIVSNIYLYLTILIFIIGLIGNGISIIVLLSTKLRYLSVYKNLSILCFLNILYLISILIRYKNNYQQDLRDISIDFCRLHTFTVAFIGHLCSWQLVSTSIQRVYALLSLQSHQTTSWIRIWSIFLICIVFPLFTFDAQLLFNYGFLKNTHTCNEPSNYEIKQFRRALQYPIYSSKNISLHYYTNWIPSQSETINKGNICILWNTLDTFIYAIIPFIITLICNLIIIIKVCQRRRSTVILGGICHTNRVVISYQDHLSTLLITINLLFLFMIGPLNICLIIQSIFECFFFKSIPIDNSSFFFEFSRLLQNSYHALSFIFYCVIGNKFRESAKSICRTIYYKLFEFSIFNRCIQIPMISYCFTRRRSSSSGHTVSSNSRFSDTKRTQLGQRKSSFIPLNTVRRPTYVTFDINQKTLIHCTTAF
ncbi:unnamed protein product [Adineta steineri]|uniref:G-protein coupled receptors family 1 profile domain-containing protein n=1 Tax=Adineta steineri TaxID=433720 RepID=A0A813YRH2_9BILA|nr:unnamed protein product [Adineta steineri]CAF0888101.1 unnamed protein product [Adineta steineri]